MDMKPEKMYAKVDIRCLYHVRRNQIIEAAASARNFRQWANGSLLL